MHKTDEKKPRYIQDDVIILAELSQSQQLGIIPMFPSELRRPTLHTTI